MADLAGLIERVGKLTGPDRELDAEICSALQICPDFDGSGLIPPITFRVNPEQHGWVQVLGCNGMSVHSRAAYPLTVSLDAAVALVERCLPGWYWRTGRTSLFPNGWAYISRTHPSHCDREDEASCADGKAANPAIALLLALLRALQSQEADLTTEGSVG